MTQSFPTTATLTDANAELARLREENTKLLAEKAAADQAAAEAREAVRKHEAAASFDQPTLGEEEDGLKVIRNKVGSLKHPHNFQVFASGKKAKDVDRIPVVVKGCCDESEAIRVFCVVCKIESRNNEFQVMRV